MNQRTIVRIFLFVIGLLVFTLFSCKKETNTCEQEGKIFAYDFRECLCCPGWYIVIGDDTLKLSSVPAEDALWNKVNTEGFPVYVKVTYQPVEGECADENFEATCLKITN